MENLVEKLLKVQKELKAPKNQKNNFGGYNYRSAEDILEAVKPLNIENGLLLKLSDEPVLIGEWHYIKATAIITDGEQTHEVTAYAREAENKKGQDPSQTTGSSSSYARKYALNGLYLIDDTKDADTDEYQKQSKNSKQQPKQPPNELNSEITTKFATAIQTAGGKDALYEKLGKSKKDMETLLQSGSKKQKEGMINQLDTILIDGKGA